MLRGEGFFEEVVGAVAHGFHRHGHVAVAGQQNHRQARVLLLQALEQLHARQPRHAHIAEDHPGEVVRQLRQALFGAGEQLYAEAGQAQPLLHCSADTGFVIDDDH